MFFASAEWGPDKQERGGGASSLPAGFEQWWQCRGETVEPLNQRRRGESGVQRVQVGEALFYIKRQRNHLYRSLRHPLGYPTAMREYRALQALRQAGINVPDIVFAQARRRDNGWEAVLVTRALVGYRALDDWYASGGRERLGEAMHAQLLYRIGHLLGRMHAAHWQHTSLYPKHIFLTAGSPQELPKVALIDLEKARRRWRVTKAAQRDLAQLQRRSSGFWRDGDWRDLLTGHAAALANR